MEIDITGVDLKEFIKKVYELSVPQGLGFLHFNPKPMSDEEAQEIAAQFNPGTEYNSGLHLDYVSGRACKMNIGAGEKGKMFIRSPWYDHSDIQLKELLDTFNISFESENEEHGCACNCSLCQTSRGGPA